MCVDGMQHTIEKISMRATTLLQTSSQSEGLHLKLWRPKVMGVPTLVISGLPLGGPKTKSHLDVGPVERCRVYYKGEGGGFPQVWAMVNLVCPCCPWFVLAPKVLQLYTNHLMLVFCRSLWVSEACQLFLVPSWSSNTPLYPSKVLRAGERAPTLYSFVVLCLGFTFESFKELGMCHKCSSINNEKELYLSLKLS
jgi:hypothetical protein